jgi:ribonuclease P protein component
MVAASDLSFPRSARLLAKVQFDAAFADGRRCASRFFRASVGNPSNTGVSLGLAVSRRVSKLAVQRNRLKRSVRESFRCQRALLPALDIVISAKPEAVIAEAEALRQDLAKLWQRIAALKPSEHSGTMRGAF